MTAAEQVRRRGKLVGDTLLWCRDFALTYDFDGDEEMVAKCDKAMEELHKLLAQVVPRPKPRRL